MSTLVFLRHGQAGTRNDYDRLSKLGREQARLLAEWLQEQEYRFTRAISGPLQRQRETAQLALGGAVVDSMWAEFDLDAVYAGVAPQLARADDSFRQSYEEQQRIVAGGDAAIHRQWTMADTAVMRAWVEGRFDFDGESWLEFNQRIARAAAALRELPKDEVVAISTSAVPIGITIGLALGLNTTTVLRLAAAIWNTSITVMRAGESGIDLLSFNGTPHLREARLRTLR